MNLQEFYRQEYRRLRPSWRDSRSLYRDLIASRVNFDTKILDVGCGHGEFMKSVYARTPHTYGLDPDAEALEKNKIMQHKVVGRVERMPFEANFFDAVVSEWVLEHLDDPVAAFREIHRVLKPGGSVVFLTPNVWNYNVWMIRMVPNSLHGFFTQLLYDRQKGDTYPVRYRINSPAKIERTLSECGFAKKQLMLNGDPSYISFNRSFFYFACALERLLDYSWLQSARVHLIGMYEKGAYK